MQDRGGGRHVLIGSSADHQGLAGNAAYGSTKFGLRGLHQALRAEYRDTGVLCTLVSPGPVDTAAWNDVDLQPKADVPARAAMLRPEDLAGLIRWIAAQPNRVDIDWIRLGPA
jgi:NADP-dependent 3-hydroxy acid dehydrogenase YdfG